MLGFLRKTPPPQKTVRVPAGTRLYVVGDIHGRVDLLRRLLDQILADAQGSDEWHKELIFLGDYVDRGFHSKDVLELLRTALPQDFTPVFLRGNHEDAMIKFIDGDLMTAVNWFYFGGRETVASYGLPPPPQTLTQDKVAAIHQNFMEKLPRADIDFLRATRLHYQCGDYSFVHAGVRPGLPFERQMREDLMFIRNEFLQSDADFGSVIVHGHTIADRPEIRHNRIGIDTGAYATGKLTCLVLEGGNRRFLQT